MVMYFLVVPVLTFLYALGAHAVFEYKDCSKLPFSSQELSRLMTKPTKRMCAHCRPEKTPISLGIRPVWSESSLCAQSVAKDPSFLHADSEDSGQTGRMPRLIWVFAGRICQFVGFVMRWLNFDRNNFTSKRKEINDVWKFWFTLILDTFAV